MITHQSNKSDSGWADAFNNLFMFERGDSGGIDALFCVKYNWAAIIFPEHYTFEKVNQSVYMYSFLFYQTTPLLLL